MKESTNWRKFIVKNKIVNQITRQQKVEVMRKS